MADMPI
jgi:hypothetical protein